MKRTYSKPEIMFESFVMSTSIAAVCERIVGNPTAGTCAVSGTGGVNVFTDEMNACDYTPGSFNQPEDTWDGFCYHVPTDKNELFNS